MLLRLAGLVLACMVVLTASARADERYTVEGRDRFRIAGAPDSEIRYNGVGRLSAVRAGNATRYSTTISYERIAGGATAHLEGSFAATISAGGAQRDEVDRDPDDLTILDQPFAAQLDAATLHDLRELRSAMPFDFPSPMTGGTLHGSLRRLPDGVLNGERVLGIAFSAAGPLRGALADRSGLSIAGTISMNGRAYYAYAGAFLVALDATLAIQGDLGGPGAPRRIAIVYRRSIRPSEARGRPDARSVERERARESEHSVPKRRNRSSDERG